MALEAKFGVCEIDTTLLGSTGTPPASGYIREGGKVAMRLVIVSSHNP